MFVNNLFGEYLCVLGSFYIRSHRLTFLYTYIYICYQTMHRIRLRMFILESQYCLRNSRSTEKLLSSTNSCQESGNESPKCQRYFRFYFRSYSFDKVETRKLLLYVFVENIFATLPKVRFEHSDLICNWINVWWKLMLGCV